MSTDMEVAVNQDLRDQTVDLIMHLKIPLEDLEKMPAFEREMVTRYIRAAGHSNAAILHYIADFVAKIDGADHFQARRAVRGEALSAPVRALDLEVRGDDE